jgi:hypothetical protein
MPVCRCRTPDNDIVMCSGESGTSINFTFTTARKMPHETRYKHLQILKHLFLQIETQLEKKGHFERAQWLRFKQYLWWEARPSKLWNWSHTLIELDIRIREVVQRELLLKDTCSRLAANPGIDNVELYCYTKDLDALNQEYWRLEKAYLSIEKICPSEPAKRAYDSVRRDHRWHLTNSWLRRDCANRGGCCGRGCHCCENSPPPNRMKGWGHCTIQCKCCYRTRDPIAYTADRKLCQPEFHIGDEKNSGWDPYSLALHTAYVWGLESR